MTLDDISISNHKVDGITISAMYRDRYVWRRYIDYSVAEAKQLFLVEFGGPDNPIVENWGNDSWV